MPNTTMQWRSRIDRAISSGGLVFQRQCIFLPMSRSPSFYELLVRLAEPSGELIPAARFINDAVPEQLKAIDQLAAIGAINQAQSTGIPHAFNLSGHTLNDLSFPTFLSEQIDKSSVNPRCLILECTEQVALLMVSTQVLAALRELRIQVSLDDLGAGYASIPAVLAIAPDILKVDGSIVRLLAIDHWRESIVYGIMAGAHHHGLKLVLEHIESGLIEGRAIALAEDFPGLNLYFQGWLYGKSEICG
ncbi:MAG: EAL domain-containing protein [Verrucomicrobia bacterium]|nr:EAL domain-containing protein [Leptolyngbya sp. ES-bin-22]